MRTRINFAFAAALTALLAVPGGAGAHPQVSGSLHEFGEIVDYPMIFPVADGAEYTYYWDTFWAGRSDGIHHAQDIMAPKMTPVVAPVDGTVHWVNWSSNPNDLNPERCCNLTIDHDDGWESWYIHLNNDTPGTDDGLAWGIAPGILPGTRVEAGQLIGWVGDSGNAENTGPHLHFELLDPEDTRVNPIRALDEATQIDLSLTCRGEIVTIRGTTGSDLLVGTEGNDVIHGRSGADTIDGKGGDDIICGGAGNDLLTGGTGDDALFGNGDDDIIRGNAGADVLAGGRGRDVLAPGKGSDEAQGGSGQDRFMAGLGNNTLGGGGGKDTVVYRASPVGVAADLGEGAASAAGTDTLADIERLTGSPLADVLIGDAGANVLRGGAGDDMLDGRDGDDKLIGGTGSNELIGGGGEDWCSEGQMIGCEAGPD